MCLNYKKDGMCSELSVFPNGAGSIIAKIKGCVTARCGSLLSQQVNEAHLERLNISVVVNHLLVTVYSP